MHSFLHTYLDGTFFPLLDVYERNFFSDGGGEVHLHLVHPPPLHTHLSPDHSTSDILLLILVPIEQIFSSRDAIS